MEYALELHGLCKQYPGFTLGPLDLTLPMGSILGFIGGERRGGKAPPSRRPWGWSGRTEAPSACWEKTQNRTGRS